MKPIKTLTEARNKRIVIIKEDYFEVVSDDPLPNIGYGGYIQSGFTCLDNTVFNIGSDDDGGYRLNVVASRDIKKNEELYINWQVPKLIKLPEMDFPIRLKDVREGGTSDIINTYGRYPLSFTSQVTGAWKALTKDVDIKDCWTGDIYYLTRDRLDGVLRGFDSHFFGNTLNIINPVIKPSETLKSRTLAITDGMFIYVNASLIASMEKVDCMIDGVCVTSHKELLLHVVAHELCHIMQNYYLDSDDYTEFGSKGVYGHWHDGIFGHLVLNIFGHPMGATNSSWQRPSNRFKRLSLAQLITYNEGDMQQYKKRV
jgi:hypothetical protein